MTLELDPNDPFTHDLFGDAYERKRLQKDAIGEWNKALRLTGDNDLATTLERTFASSGFDAAVRVLWQKKLERFIENTKRGQYIPAMSYVRAYLRLADNEQAFAWMAKAEPERNGIFSHVQLDPAFDSLRSYPRFQELSKR